MISVFQNRAWTLAAAIALVFVAANASADEFDRSFRFEGSSLKVVNLIGGITIEGTDGSAFEVEAHVRGADATEERITFDADDAHGKVLSVRFPLDEERHFVYPALGDHEKTSFTPDRRRSGLASLFGTDRIEVKGSGSGLEVWVDLTIRVPREGELVLQHAVGALESNGVVGDLDLSVSSGSAIARKTTGSLSIDTGAGHVEVDELDGNLIVDTGSGHVDTRSAKSSWLSIDTGSGHVALDGVESRKIEVDTGSGHVELNDVRCATLAVDTGSGQVTADELKADAVDIDTGSGGVRLDLAEMGEGNFVVDTGSGGIVLRLPANASARVVAETALGGIDVDVDDAAMLRKEKNEVEFEVGGGAARVSLDAGSGHIEVSSR